MSTQTQHSTMYTGKYTYIKRKKHRKINNNEQCSKTEEYSNTENCTMMSKNKTTENTENTNHDQVKINMCQVVQKKNYYTIKCKIRRKNTGTFIKRKPIE